MAKRKCLFVFDYLSRCSLLYDFCVGLIEFSAAMEWPAHRLESN
jgi:hypothetical protein